MRDAIDSGGDYENSECIMRDIDILAVFGECGSAKDFTKKDYQTVMSFAHMLEKEMLLTDAQHQYLAAIYDRFISSKYGLEPMATDKEYAAKRAIGKLRDPR